MNEKNLQNAIIIVLIITALVLITVASFAREPATGLLGMVFGAIGVGLSGGKRDIPNQPKDRTPPVDAGRDLRELGETASRTAKEQRERLERIDRIVDDSKRRTEDLKERGAEIRAESGGLADAIRKGIAKGKQ